MHGSILKVVALCSWLHLCTCAVASQHDSQCDITGEAYAHVLLQVKSNRGGHEVTFDAARETDFTSSLGPVSGNIDLAAADKANLAYSTQKEWPSPVLDLEEPELGGYSAARREDTAAIHSSLSDGDRMADGTPFLPPVIDSSTLMWSGNMQEKDPRNTNTFLTETLLSLQEKHSLARPIPFKASKQPSDPSISMELDPDIQEAAVTTVKPIQLDSVAAKKIEASSLGQRMWAQIRVLTSRLWAPVVELSRHVQDKVSDARQTYGPGVFIVLAMALTSSGIAVLTVGRITLFGELGNSRLPWLNRPKPPDSVSRVQSATTSIQSLQGAQSNNTNTCPPTSRSSQRELTPWGMPLPASHYLCPGLVVPRGQECVLAVPSSLITTGSATVRDLAGQPVLKVSMPAGGTFEKNQAIFFDTCERLDDTCIHPASTHLAFCKLEHRTVTPDRAHLHRSDGTVFATISADASSGSDARYQLASAHGGVRMLLEGDFQQHDANMWSDSRVLFSEASSRCRPGFETSERYWQLRVFANMDVCLALSAFICTEVLDSSRKGSLGDRR